jgi:O-antigen ligase
MAYPRTIAEKPTAAEPAPLWKRHSNAAVPEEVEAYDPALHKAKVAFFFLLVFTALVFGRPSDIFWGLQDVPLAQIGALAACSAYALARLQGGAPFIWTTEMKFVLALTVFYSLGLPFAFWRQMTFDTLTKEWVRTLIVFFLITQTVFTLDRIRKLFWVIIICELLVSAYSLVDPRSNIVLDEGRMRGSTVGFLSGNYLGIAAATSLPYIAVFLVRSRSFVKSFTLASTFGLLMIMVMRTASRGSLIAVILALALVWVIVLRDSMRARMMGFLFLLAILVGMLLAPAVFWERVSTMWDKESFATSDDARSAGESEFQRKALVRRSIQYTLENPIFGLGLGNFAIRSGSEWGAQDWKGTHNTYLQVAAEGGLPAFIILICLLVSTTRKMRALGKIPGDDPTSVELRQMGRATLVSLYCFMFSAIFAHLAYDVYLYYLIGISVALQAHWNRVKNPGNGETRNGNGRSRLRAAYSGAPAK